MTDVDLKDFEKKVRVRPLTPGDYEAVVELQKKCFVGMKPWAREQFDSQMRLFQEGQIGVEIDGKLVASSSSLVVDFSRHDGWHNWKQIADSGYIRNHDPQGDTLYGIEIMVDPEFRGMKLARRLYQARKDLARKLNVKRIIIGGRIPGYGKHAEKMSAREYVEKVVEKALVDPVLTTQISNGFVLKELIPDYFPSDSESRGYATFLEWANLDHAPKGAVSAARATEARVCIVQYEMRKIASFDDFAGQCEYFVDVAADYRSDFVVFPELLTTQLLSTFERMRPGLAARKLSEFTPAYLEFFTRCAIKYNINILGGSHFSVENDKLYNIAYLFRRDGTLGKQYKLHVTPDERRWWGVAPGSSLEVFDTDRGRISILICYDVEFPELGRLAAARGAEILFVPFNTDERYGYLRVRHCAQARSIENDVYTVIAGCVGNLPPVDNADVHYAQSAIFTPSDFPFDRDAIAAESAVNIEAVVIHDLELARLRRQRGKGTVRNWQDRRTDLYRIRYTGPEGNAEV